jgi:ferredoxin
MYRITAELEVCQGFANCSMNAPDLFDLDENDVVVLLREEIADDELAHADQAVRACPVTALKLERESE